MCISVVWQRITHLASYYFVTFLPIIPKNKDSCGYQEGLELLASPHNWLTAGVPLNLVVGLFGEPLPVLGPLEGRGGGRTMGGTHQLHPVSLLGHYRHLRVVHQGRSRVTRIWNKKHVHLNLFFKLFLDNFQRSESSKSEMKTMCSSLRLLNVVLQNPFWTYSFLGYLQTFLKDLIESPESEKKTCRHSCRLPLHALVKYAWT